MFHLAESVLLVREIAAVVDLIADVRKVDTLAVPAAPLLAGAGLPGDTALHACHLAAKRRTQAFRTDH